MFEVDVTRAVGAIDRTIDHAHVAFTFGGCRSRRRLTGARSRRRVVSRHGLRNLFTGGAVVERDVLAVGRPLWTTSAARQRRELKRLAARHCEHEELRRFW